MLQNVATVGGDARRLLELSLLSVMLVSTGIGLWILN